MRPTSGNSAVRLGATGDTLIAAGVRASRGDGVVTTPRRACCATGPEQLEVLVVSERTPGAEIRLEALRRAEQLVSNNQVDGHDLIFLVGGSILGRLDESEQAAEDVLSAGDDQQDVIDGPRALRPRYLRADELLREAA